MNIPTPKDKFVYIHDDYEDCAFCANKYKGYSIFGYPGLTIDVDFHREKMRKMSLVVDAPYKLTYFVAKHSHLLKKERIPHDLITYAEYLKENHRLDEHKEKNVSEKDYADHIKSKVTDKRKGLFQIKTIPINTDYLEHCIFQNHEQIFLGVDIKPNEISAARVNEGKQGGVEDYKKFKDLDENIKNTIFSLNPEPSFNILAAYHAQEEFDEDAIRQFLFSGKQLIESINEFVYLKDTEFEALLNKIAYLCHLWKERKDISNKFFKEANDFILYKRTVPTNPVIDFLASFFDSLIDDMKANNQLIECAHCHLLAKYFRNKKFCSKATDGKNCFGQYHSKKDYSRHKSKRLNTKRAWIKKTRKEIPGY